MHKVDVLADLPKIQFVNLSWIGARKCPTWPIARENAERQIQIKYSKIQTFIKSHMQDSKLKLHSL